MVQSDDLHGLRIGVDIMPVSSVEHALRGPDSERYVERCFTSREVAESTVGGRLSAPRLAARFAAKEAVFKALVPNDHAFVPRFIEIVCRAGGYEVRLADEVAARAASAGVTDVTVSVSLDRVLAMAIAAAFGANAEPGNGRSRTARATGQAGRSCLEE